jgi:hypothetical protein
MRPCSSPRRRCPPPPRRTRARSYAAPCARRRHGALQALSGRIEVSWVVVDRAEGKEFLFRWIESGGSEVTPPPAGFGSRIIKENLAGGILWRGRPLIRARRTSLYSDCFLAIQLERGGLVGPFGGTRAACIAAPSKSAVPVVGQLQRGARRFDPASRKCDLVIGVSKMLGDRYNSASCLPEKAERSPFLVSG